MAEDAATPTWSRKVGWRQGHAVPADALAALGIANETDILVMVVSHDCDLANDDLEAEPYVEVIVGRALATANPSLTRTMSASHSRVLGTQPARSQRRQPLATQPGLSTMIPPGTSPLLRSWPTPRPFTTPTTRRVSSPKRLVVDERAVRRSSRHRRCSTRTGGLPNHTPE